MQTPPGKAGVLTERIMAQIEKNDVKLPAHSYNRVYEAVHSVLADQEAADHALRGVARDILSTKTAIDMAKPYRGGA